MNPLSSISSAASYETHSASHRRSNKSVSETLPRDSVVCGEGNIEDESLKLHSRSLSKPGPSLQKLIDAASKAPKFMVEGNNPENFNLEGEHEVDKGSMASHGNDSRGREIWVVDQKIRYPAPPGDLSALVLDGFFCGGSAGTRINGPRAKLLATEKNGTWSEAPDNSSSEKGLRKSPFKDPKVSRFICEMSGVKPFQAAGDLLPPASFKCVVDTGSAVRSRDKCEFTLHFLNPDGTMGPFPGTADGAVRYRATRNSDGTVTMEGYYVNRAAREYMGALTDSMPLGKEGKKLFSLGNSLFNMTPVGMITAPFTSAMGRAMESVADSTIGATGMVREAVTTLHAKFYRTVLFPNLLGN